MPWFNKKVNSRRDLPGKRKRTLRPESLQRRELMAADFIGFDVDVQSGVMHIEGTDQADAVEVFIDNRGTDDPVDDLVQVKMTEANGDQRTGGSPRYWQDGTPRITSLKFEGFDGNDRFTNRTTLNSVAHGGEGDDFMIGGSGVGRFFGELGSDWLFGGSGRDVLDGGRDDDLLMGGRDNDVLNGGRHDDRIFGGSGDDTIRGGSGADYISGWLGDDEIFGDSGDDTIRGGRGNDMILGGRGDDNLKGDQGHDSVMEKPAKTSCKVAMVTTSCTVVLAKTPCTATTATIWMLERDKKVFCDLKLKFFDIPATVGSAVRQLKDRGASFVTVHGNQSIMEAAAENKGDTLKVLGVTVLTSLDRGDLDDLGFDCDVGALVLSRAKRALEAGCDGVVSSGLEVPKLREFDRREAAGRNAGHSSGRQQARW